MIGQTIAHYRILEKLGQGGMGVVYKAEDTHLGRVVALKFPPPQASQNAEERQRLIHEAKAAAALDHPHICTIHEIGEADGQPYIAMAFVEGDSLRARIDDGPLDVAEAVRIAGQVAEGLSAAHEKGITHRDIKPENIMINARGQVKIMDFGLAKSSRQVTKITQEGSTPGTAAYMSPEQAKGEGVDARSDLWSLGVVLYESLSGKLPFQGTHPAALMYAVLHEPHTSVSDHRPRTPADLVSLIDRLLRKDPVQRPVDTKAVANELAQIRDILTGKSSSQPGVRDPAQPSLAVLPFANMSTDPENEFFADGLTEDLITAFSKMESLRVVARTSAFQFKGKTTDVRRVGEQLNVGTVLEGSVRKSGTRLRVTAQLINVADGFHIWSERYDREMADVFEIQDDIARAIVDALKVKLVGQKDAPLVQGGTSNLAAYRLLLEGRHHWNQRTAESLAKAEVCFLEAIRLDPMFADAYGALALTYAVMQDHAIVSHSELHTKIEQAANAALKLSPEMPEAHAAMSLCLMDAFDWEGAERAMLHVIDANPGYASGHHWYSLILGYQGRLEESRREVELAQSLDPLSLIVAASVSWPYYYQRDYEKALKQVERARKLDPNFHLVHFCDGMVRSAMGQHREAAASFREAQALNPRPWVWLGVADCEYQAGRFDQMIDALERWCNAAAPTIAQSEFRTAYASDGLDGLKRRIGELLGVPWADAFGAASGHAYLFVTLGNHDCAFAWLEAGISEGSPMIRGLAVDPHWDPLRADARFPLLLKKLHLPVL